MVLIMECNSCGAQINDDVSKCPYCGVVVSRPTPVPAEPVSQCSTPIKPRGSVGDLVIWIFIFWPGAIYYYMTRDWKSKLPRDRENEPSKKLF